MKHYKVVLSMCMILLFSLFIGKTDSMAAMSTLTIGEEWTNGNLEEKGTYDYYKITVPEAGTLTITYQGLGIGYSYAYVYSEDLEEVYAKSDLLGNTSETSPKTENVEVDVQKGTYTVRVHGHAGSSTGTYRLKASFVSAGSNEIEPNDSYNAAMSLAGQKNIIGFLPINDDHDFYKFTLNRKTQVDIRYINYYNGGLPKPGVDGIIAIYDDNYRELHRERPINAPFEVHEEFDPGTYYIKVNKFYGGSGLYFLQYSDMHTHMWNEGEIKSEATCTQTGERVFTCETCKATKSESILALAHVWDGGKVKSEATCRQTGEKVFTCRNCKATKSELIPMIAHKLREEVKKATTKKNGERRYICTVCSTVVKRTEIPYAKKVSLSSNSLTYNGKKRKPKVAVLDAKKNPIEASNFSVKFAKGCRDIGSYKVTVTLKGDYTGTLSATYKIVPRAPKLTSVKSSKKAFTAKWKKLSSKEVTGYQVQYSLKKSFKGQKTLKLTGSSKTSVKKTGLKAKKIYYVRARAYKKVSGKTYYSAWSNVKSVKVKK